MWFWFGRLRPVLVIVFLVLTTIISPVSTVYARGINTTYQLRILPLGDSLTYGLFSAGGNGYRLYLMDLLTDNNVQFIGSQQNGNMTDNYNEGHNGALIDEIAYYAQRSLPERPNIILVLAGTNDCLKPQSPTTAAIRLENLVDEISAACPDAVIVLARIPPLANISREAYVFPYNYAMRRIVDQRAKAGKHILLVDMHSRLGVSNLQDGIHPTEYGYSLMAQVWYGGFQQAAANGWISEPIDTIRFPV